MRSAPCHETPLPQGHEGVGVVEARSGEVRAGLHQISGFISSSLSVLQAADGSGKNPGVGGSLGVSFQTLPLHLHKIQQEQPALPGHLSGSTH